ncbi:MAG: MerR family transcriptional regulator [Solirubrobacteraceae bacterium]|nr:MerR family transcriptional regulator [Solirubrobacteraceae bacterium]
MNSDGLLKMSELAERSGVSSATIKHYLREGLLGDGGGIVRTSRNMAYYPPDYVDRIQLIKRLQEDRFMPLRVIREVIEDDPDKARRLLEVEERILERALEAQGDRIGADEAQERFAIPLDALGRLGDLGVVSPVADGYDPEDVKILEAISRFRAGGYDERLGFTVYDTLRYRDALAPVVEEEVRTFIGRLAGQVDPDEAVEIVSSGVEPLRDLLGAMHTRMLLAELRRARDAK